MSVLNLKKNILNNNTIIRTKRNLAAVIKALELGKLGAWSLGVFVAALAGNTATTVIDQDIRESYAKKAEARIANRLKSACEIYNVECVMGFCYSNCGPR